MGIYLVQLFNVIRLLFSVDLVVVVVVQGGDVTVLISVFLVVWLNSYSAAGNWSCIALFSLR